MCFRNWTYFEEVCKKATETYKPMIFGPSIGWGGKGSWRSYRKRNGFTSESHTENVLYFLVG